MELPVSYKVYSRYYQKIGPFFKKPRVQAYIMLILSFFTMSFFGIFAIRPTLKTITQLQRKIKDSQFVSQALEEKIISLSQAKEAYQKVEKSLPLIAKALPPEPQFSFFLQDLESLAQEVDATISGVKLESVDLTKKDPTLPIKLSCFLALASNYPSGKEFIHRLIETPRLYTIENFEIRSRAKEGETELKLDLKVNSFYFEPNFDVQ